MQIDHLQNFSVQNNIPIQFSTLSTHSNTISNSAPSSPIQFPTLLHTVQYNFQRCSAQSNTISNTVPRSPIQFPTLPRAVQCNFQRCSTQFNVIPNAVCEDQYNFRRSLSHESQFTFCRCPAQPKQLCLLYFQLPVIHASKSMVLHHCQLSSPHL